MQHAIEICTIFKQLQLLLVSSLTYLSLGLANLESTLSHCNFERVIALEVYWFTLQGFYAGFLNINGLVLVKYSVQLFRTANVVCLVLVKYSVQLFRTANVVCRSFVQLITADYANVY
jgi:hypothetical protein